VISRDAQMIAKLIACSSVLIEHMSMHKIKFKHNIIITKQSDSNKVELKGLIILVKMSRCLCY